MSLSQYIGLTLLRKRTEKTGNNIRLLPVSSYIEIYNVVKGLAPYGNIALSVFEHYNGRAGNAIIV